MIDQFQKLSLQVVDLGQREHWTEEGKVGVVQRTVVPHLRSRGKRRRRVAGRRGPAMGLRTRSALKVEGEARNGGCIGWYVTCRHN